MCKLNNLLLLLCMTVALSGCIKEKIEVILNKDGSGEVVISHKVDDVEQVLKNIESDPAKAPKFKYLTLQEVVEKKDGSVWRVSTYSFKNLDKALPELEHEVVMMPRFAKRGDKFVVFLEREKGDYDGQSVGTEEAKEMFYHLTVKFPVSPVSENGLVDGTSVSWEFNGEELNELRKKDIGTVLLSASVPAKEIVLNPKPRLVGKPVRKLFHRPAYGDSPKNVLSSFTANIPILESPQTPEKDYNAAITVNFPVDSLPSSFAYRELKVLKIVVDGKVTKATLKSEKSGAYSGVDQWGRKITGLPVTARLMVDTPWTKRVDLMKVSLQIDEPTSTECYSIKMDKNTAPKIHAIAGDMSIIIAKVEKGSSTAMLPAPSITLVSTCDRSAFSAIYLDTDYGLRYKLPITSWKETKVSRIWQADIKEQATKLTSENETIYLATLSPKNIPSAPFSLVVETVIGKKTVQKILKLENVNVVR